MADSSVRNRSRAGGWTRRSLLRSGLGLASSAAIGAPWIARADEGSLKLALIAAKSGAFAELGKACLEGASFAVEQAGGSVLGRKLELIWLDDQTPQIAEQNMRKAIEEEKVVAVMGGTNSATSLAMSAVSRNKKIPYIVTNGAAREITGSKCHRYVFRDNTTIPAGSRLVAPIAAAMGRNWYYIVGAYAMGADIYKTLRDDLAARGCNEVGSDQVPVGTSDFSSLIIKISETKPDGIICGLAGHDLDTFLKQFAEFGLKGKIAIVGPTIADEDLWSLDPADVVGVWGIIWHYKDPRNAPDEMEMADAIFKRTGRPASQTNYLGWIAAKMMLAGIEKAGETDPLAIVKGLETVRLPSGAHYRAWDHQLMHRAVVLRAKENIASQWDVVDVIDSAPKSADEMDAFFGSAEQIGCKMLD